MATLRPFSCIRPKPELAAQIASGPHSFMSQEEIRQKVKDNPLSYSRIVHPRVLFDGRVSTWRVYRTAAETLDRWVTEKVMIRDESESFYLYRLEYEGHVQTGLVGCTDVDDVLNQKIRAHEKIRRSKLRDLSVHMEICGAQIGGPILMAYRRNPEIADWMEEVSARNPEYDFLSENGILNRIWKIDDAREIAWVREKMEQVPCLYIADGHHRVMAAVEICRRKRETYPDYDGEEPWNRFACVCFPDDSLQILPYSRVTTGLNGRTEEAFRTKIRELFHEEEPCADRKEVLPRRRGEFAMYLGHRWQRLSLREELRPRMVPDSLDVKVLYDRILNPILEVDRPGGKTRLEFIGGRQQQRDVEERCEKYGGVGFVPYPISMEELLAVADAGATMPPKSTWFEPKLCNGLFIHTFG